MVGRAFVFLFLGIVEGVALGSVFAQTLVSSIGATTTMPVVEAATYWGILGAIHGVILFLASLGEEPVIEDISRRSFVVSSFATKFDYRRFGHRIPYIAVVFGIVVSFGIAPLLAQQAEVEVTSVGLRLLVGFGVCFVWTGIAMLINTIIVSKIALN